MNSLRINHAVGPPRVLVASVTAAIAAVIVGFFLDFFLVLRLVVATSQSPDRGQGIVVVGLDIVAMIYWVVPLLLVQNLYVRKAWKFFLFPSGLAAAVITITAGSYLGFARLGISGDKIFSFLTALHYGVIYGTLYFAVLWAMIIDEKPLLVAPVAKKKAISSGMLVCLGIVAIWVSAVLLFFPV